MSTDADACFQQSRTGVGAADRIPPSADIALAQVVNVIWDVIRARPKNFVRLRRDLGKLRPGVEAAQPSI